MALKPVTLDDKYLLDRGRAYLTGTQALVRLPMVQRQRDAAAGLNTGCFISGYRGSPLGGLDQALWAARRFIQKNGIHFQPAINEELGATAIWGSQQLGLFPGAKYDGVFAMWYAKGPGVDRSGDALKHGNAAGSAPHGGVLLLAGDDHTCKSSTLAHQSEYAFMDACIPVLNPSGVQEILDLGLYGWAMSRYSGCWIAFKTIAETVDSSAAVEIAPERIDIAIAGRFRDAAGRAQHPLAGPAARAGIPAAQIQALRRARLRPRQPARPHRHRQPAAAVWHRDNREILSRRAPGARRSRHRRGPCRRDRHPPLQGRDVLAARTRRHPPFRRRARRNSGGRGKARRHREPVQGAALQLAGGRAPARHRQIRRGAQLDPAVERRIDAGADRPGHRRTHRALSQLAPHRRAARLSRGQGTAARRRQCRAVPAHALFLLGLPAQHFDQGTGGEPRARRHRLPLPLAVHGPLDGDLHPDGRRGGAVDRPGALHRNPARLRQSRRRHLYPFGRARDPRRRRRQGQHHLQAPVQRRGRDDRRPADGWRPDRAAADPPTRRRGGRPHCRRHRRTRQISARRRFRGRNGGAPPRRSRRRAARTARYSGCDGDRLRPDLRRRKAPPAQARALSRPGQAGRHQRSGLRGLRRLLDRRRTASRSCRSRPSSAASGRSTSRAATRIIPASRASARALSRCMAAS